MSDQEDISRLITGISLQLETLASINETNMIAPGWSPARYHRIIKETYAALRNLEMYIDTLRSELEYQHMRLDEIRDLPSD